MTARPIRYQRQVSDRNGKIFYTSIASLSHISKFASKVTVFHFDYFSFGINFIFLLRYNIV